MINPYLLLNLLNYWSIKSLIVRLVLDYI